MRLARLAAVALCCCAPLAALTACEAGNAGSNARVDVVVAGASTIQPVMDSIAPLFEKTHPNVRVQVQGGGSSVGATAPLKGLAQIGMVSRPLHDDEKVELQGHKLGDDGIAIIVHKDNPMSNIGKDDVVKIFSGASASWKDFGGAERPITVINKEEGRSTLELFENHFELKGRFAKNAVIIGPNGQGIATTAASLDAIAYVSIGSAEAAIAAGTAIKALALDGVAPTTENVKNGTFPLRRALHLVTKGAPTGAAKELIDFVLSPAGQRVVAEQGFVPVGPTG